MRRFLYAFIVGAATCQIPDLARAKRAPDCPARPGSENSALIKSIDPLVETAAKLGFAGQVAIMEDGVIVYSRAAGAADLAGETPVTDATLFHVASVTKYFTAALTLKAVEEGRLALAASSEDLFPGLALASRSFTVADLLSHRTGLRSTYAAESETDADAALDAIAKANRDYQNDDAFHYANDNYDVLTIVLERIYGQRYETIFRHMIAAPACLRNFGFWGETALSDPKILGQPLTPVNSRLKRRNYGMIGSAGLLITAKDLLAWEHALVRGRILGDAALAELRAPRGDVSIGRALFGSFLIDSPHIGEAVSARGAESWGDNAYLNDYLECGFTVAVVTSRGPAESSGAPLFRDTLIDAIEEKLAPFCKDFQEQ